MHSRFKIPPDRPSSPLKPVAFVSAPIGGADVTHPQVVTYLHSHTAATMHAAQTRLMKRLGSGRFAQGFLKAPPIRKNDPYILLLLADQERDEGREEQARSLIEAAYEAYDQQNESAVYSIRPAG